MVERPARFAMSIADAAHYVGVSERSIADAIRSGDLAARYLGSKALIKRTELEAWFEALPAERSKKGGA